MVALGQRGQDREDVAAVEDDLPAGAIDVEIDAVGRVILHARESEHVDRGAHRERDEPADPPRAPREKRGHGVGELRAPRRGGHVPSARKAHVSSRPAGSPTTP